MMKICSKCEVEKSISEYYLNTNGKHLSYCKECRKKQVNHRSKKIFNDSNKITITLKKCFQCEIEKPASGFYNNSYRIDGLTDECIDCAKEKAKLQKQKYSAGDIAHKVVLSKTCWQCGIEKEIIQFNKNKSMSDGHGTECKMCMSDYGEKYKYDNKEYFHNYIKKYLIEHPEKVLENHQRRRARKYSGNVEVFSRNDVIELYGNKCFYCIGNFEHLDHYVPLSKGGDHTLENVRPSCEKCNLRKNAKLPNEWYAYLEKKKAKEESKNEI